MIFFLSVRIHVPLSRKEGLSKRGGRGTTFSWAWLVADGYLKGLCHEMNNFFKGLKIKSVLSVYAPIVFKFFCYLVMEKLKDTILACCMKTLILIVKILPVTLIKLLVAAYRNPPMIL